MSTLKVDTILDKTGSATIPPSIPALDARMATAWVNFDGTGAVSIQDNFNVTSITDNGLGDFTLNFLNVLDNINYTLAGSASPDVVSTTTYQYVRLRTSSDKTVANVRILTGFVSSASAASKDYAENSVIIFGGKD